MTNEKLGYSQHLFICTNSPDRLGKCGSKGSENLRKTLKEQCFQEFGKGTVRVNSAGCLGYCERGIAAVIYRTNPTESTAMSASTAEWFLDLKDTDSEVLIAALKKS